MSEIVEFLSQNQFWMGFLFGAFAVALIWGLVVGRNLAAHNEGKG